MEQENKIKCFGSIYYNVPNSTAERPIDTLFTGLPKAQQYWRRQTDIPKFFYDYNPHLPDKKVCRINASKTVYSGDKLVSLSVEDTQELNRLVEREVRRMQNGVFIMVNGVRRYMPGVLYGTLQWVKMIGVNTNNGYGDFWRYQHEFSCQRQKAIDDDRLDGYYVHKIKKCGITQLINCFYVVESIVNRQFIIAEMSKNHATAKSANFKYYTYGLKNLPYVLTPSIDQSNWAGAVQKVELRVNDADLSLENVVCAVPTTDDGLDGLPPIRRINLSEMPKMADADAILKKSKEQARKQQTKVGIIEMESYPPEDDSKSFKFCRNLHTKECMKVDADGYPVNRILPLHIGITEATFGTHDIYGEPDRLKALQMEQDYRASDKCKTPAQLQARKRQYHITAKEGWEVGGGGSVYNNIALTAQEVVLQEAYDQAELNYVEGNLEWTAGRFSPVRFVPLTDEEIMGGKVRGKWRIYCTMEYLKANTNICFRLPKKKKLINKEIRLLFQPPTEVIHVSGTDPVDYAFVSEIGDTQSKNASVVKDIQGNIVSVYHARDEDPDDAIDDFCKEILFWGLYALVEGNRKVAITSLEKEGLYFFLLMRHPNGLIEPYALQMKVKHVSSSKDIISQYVTLITKRLKNSPEQFQCIDIIQQHKEFESDDTQKYDLSVADGLAEVALDAMQTWVIKKKSISDHYAGLQAAIGGLM